MRCRGLSCLAGLMLLAIPASAANDDYWLAATAAARELSRQLDYLTRALYEIPGPDAMRGFHGRLDGIQNDQLYFQQQLKRKVSRESLYLAFDKMDGKLHALLKDMKNAEKWTPALAMVANRVAAADHDLHFALSSGDNSGDRQTQSLRRQTLVLKARTDDLENMVRYAFAELGVLEPWTSALAAFRQGANAFQRLQDNNAATADLKAQFTLMDQAWQKVVDRARDLPQGQYLIIQSDAARVDQVLGRLAALLGIPRRPPLPDPLAF